jgi:hypothetical protein
MTASFPTQKTRFGLRPSGRDVHAEALHTSSELSAYYVRNLVTPIQVITILNREKISFVLVGAHGISGWMREPRATQDVDVVVAEKHIKKATRALLAEFPQLEARDHEVVVRLQDRETQDVLIDLMKPRSLYREVFKHAYPVSHARQHYRIPTLEMALAMKFAAMTSPNRQDEDKFQDAHDFIRVVKENEEVNDAKLHALGELVYGGGGADLVKMVSNVRAGERLVL